MSELFTFRMFLHVIAEHYQNNISFFRVDCIFTTGILRVVWKQSRKVVKILSKKDTFVIKQHHALLKEMPYYKIRSKMNANVQRIKRCNKEN